jgi:hypothetical protein
MSLFSSVANYGGKQPDNSQGIKQFVQSPGGQAVWIYKRLPSGIQVQTPADKIRPVYINSDLYVNGSIFNPSDANLKKDVTSVNREKTDNIINLNPVSFKFKDDVNAKEHYGFIAQEVENLYPELVKNSEMGYKTVNYIELIPVLVSKIQDLNKEIKELHQKLQAIQNYIE